MDRTQRLVNRFAPLVLCVSMAVSPGSAQAQPQPPGKILRVNDIDMHLQTLGSGEPLLLLHSFGNCVDEWQPFAQALAKQFQVIIPDLRGHGWSTNPSKVFSHRQAAADVLALLDQLPAKSVRAMGISTGGMTLLHMATRQPERIDAMVLIGATSYFPPPARAIMTAMAAGIDKMPPPVREAWQKCGKRGADQVGELATNFAAFKDSYDDMNFTTPYLRTIKARTLIVHGDRDAFFPVTIPVEMYQAIPSAELWIVPRGGHVPIFGPRQEEFLNIATEFLRRASSP